MTAVVSTDPSSTSPRVLARVAGLFYVATIVVGLFAELVRDAVIVSGDPGATARNIIASESLYRWASIADLTGSVCYIVVTLLLYELLKPVNSSLSLLAAFFSLVGVAIGAVSSILRLAPLIVLSGAHYLAALGSDQLHAIAYVLLRLQAQGLLISLVFFGVYCLLLGYLIFESTFFPRTVGVLMAIAGVCYLVNSSANFLASPLAGHLSPYILFPCLVGEGALTLWLVIVGVNVPKWQALRAHSISTVFGDAQNPGAHAIGRSHPTQP